jgi:hypothetical protein
LLADWYEHDEPDGAFLMEPEVARNKLSLHEFKQPFEAGAKEYGYGVPYDAVCIIYQMNK